MKRIVLLCICMYVINAYSQTILKVDLPTAGKVTYLAPNPQKQKGVDSVNKNLKLFNTNLTQSYLSLLRQSLNDTSIQDIPEVKELQKNIDSIQRVQPVGTAKINGKLKTDSIQAPKQPVTSKENTCPGLSKVRIKFIFGDDNTYVGIIADTTENALATFVIAQLNKELFYDKLKKALASVCDSTSGVNAKLDSLRNGTPDLYTKFLEAKEDFINTNGLAGTLIVYKHIMVHYNFKRKEYDYLKKAVSYDGHGPDVSVDTLSIPAGNMWINRINPEDTSFTIHEIQVQFQDGFIENIKVFGKVEGNNHMFRFENTYPIGFSTKRDFKRLIDAKLEERSNYHLYGRKFLNLGEVISYSQNLANNNKDYSPANQVLTIKALADSVKEIALYKEQTSKILELLVFSDLKGADNNNPNGLIQMEMNKRLNFFSRRSNISWSFLHKKDEHKTYESFANIGLFNFVTPQFTINKIENNQKRFILGHIDTLTLATDTSKPITYASTIDLLRHQLYSVGFDLSGLLIDAPNLKSTINVGIGLHFGRSAIQDTIRLRDKTNPNSILFNPQPSNNVLEYGVNTLQWGLFGTWQIFPDSRFGISTTQRFTWFKALTDNFVQVRDSAHYLNFIAHTAKDQIATTAYKTAKCLASTEIFAYFNPNLDGSSKLFFRYRLNWDVMNPKENFHQVQVGFSTYLTATKELDKLKKSVQ